MSIFKNTTGGYGWGAIGLHWILAILIIGTWALGKYMVGLDYYDSLYHQAPEWHKAIGVLIAVLMTLRFVWRQMNPLPKPLKKHRAWETSLAYIAQLSFYGLILLIVVTGYLMSTAEGAGIVLLAGVELPAFFPAFIEDQEDVMGEWHVLLTTLFLFLLILHTAGALKHHFLDKDNTLKNMIKPGDSL
jgi:cytochrome b561